MTPETAKLWIVVVALGLSVILGAGCVASASWAQFRNHALAWSSAALALVGAVLLTSPKWSEIAFNFGDYGVRVAALQKANENLTTQVATLTKASKALAADKRVLALRLASTKKAVDDYNVQLVSAVGGLPPVCNAKLPEPINFEGASLEDWWDRNVVREDEISNAAGEMKKRSAQERPYTGAGR